MPEIKIGVLLIPKQASNYNWKVNYMMYGFLCTAGHEDNLAVSDFPKPLIQRI